MSRAQPGHQSEPRATWCRDRDVLLPEIRVIRRRVDVRPWTDERIGPRRGLGQRTKLGLLIGAVAAVVVIGLAIGYAVLGIGAQPGTVPSTSSSVDPNSPPPTDTSPPASEPANVLLTDASMLRRV